MLEELDDVAAHPNGHFWSTVRAMGQANLTAAQRTAETTVALQSQQLASEEKELAVGVAVERMLRAGQRMHSAGQEIIDNHEEMDRLNRSIPWTYEVIRSQLRHENGSGAFFDTISSAIGLVGGLVSGDYGGAVESLFEIIGAIGDDSYDTSYLAGQAGQVSGLAGPARDLLGDDDDDLAEIASLAERVAGASDDTVARTNRHREGDAMYGLLQLTAAQRRISSRVRSALVNVYEDRDRAERANDVHDRARAVAHINGLIELLHRIQSLSDRNMELAREYVTAAGEVLVSEMEVNLAAVELQNAGKRAHLLACRLGRGSGCSGITPIQRSDVRNHRIAFLNASCQKARALNDNVLLLDALYYKSRDFLDLRTANDDRTARRAAAEDYRRFLVVPETRDAFSDGGRANLENLIDQLDRRFGRQDSEINGTVCRKDAEALGMQNEDEGLCAPNLQSPGEDAYSASVIEALVRDGYAELELSPLCDADIDEDERFCQPGVENGDERRRVAAFDLRFIMSERYRLPRNVGWEAIVRHGDRHTFDVSQQEQRSFYFDAHQPQRTCQAVADLLDDDNLDCESLDAFVDRVEYNDVNAGRHVMRAAPARFSDAMHSPMFGASVRGKWSIDIRPMLQDLNERDMCYWRSGSGVRTSCLPAICTDDELSDESRPMCDRLDDCADHFLRNGTLADDAPSHCAEICGPSCKAFKDELRAVDYRVSYWH